MNQEELKATVNKLLLSVHDFEPEEAEETIEQCVAAHPDFWNENANPEELANFLASGQDDI